METLPFPPKRTGHQLPRAPRGRVAPPASRASVETIGARQRANGLSSVALRFEACLVRWDHYLFARSNS